MHRACHASVRGFELVNIEPKNIMTVDIYTECDAPKSWSYSFTFNGKEYSDRDYTTRERALEEARAEVRCLSNIRQFQTGEVLQ